VITPAARTPTIIHPTGFQKFAPPIVPSHAQNAVKVESLAAIASAIRPSWSIILTGLVEQWRASVSYVSITRL